MATNQELRQASVRAVTGTAYTYNDDWMALFNNAGFTSGSFGERMLAWINDYLGAAYTTLPDAMQAFSEDQGFTSWNEMGTFDAQGGLYLDFTTGSLPDGVTASGGANGTRVNSSGVVVTASAPRFDYNPATLASLGILVEASRTNSLVRSEEFDSASWTTPAGVVNVTANTVSDPAGGTTADKLVPSASTGWMVKRQTPAIFVAGQSYDLSVFGRLADSGVHLELYYTSSTSGGAVFNLSTGAVLVSAAATTIVSDLYSGQYRRYTVRFTAGANGAGVADVRVTTASTRDTQMTGDGAKGIYVWGAHLSLAESTYIPTAGASVTRSADDIRISAAKMAGVSTLRFTFDDNTTQDVSVTPGVEYAIPTTLNRRRIKYIESV